jgi:hypothetical protein
LGNGDVEMKRLTASVHLGYPVYLQAIPWYEPGVVPVAAEEGKETGEEPEEEDEDVDRDLDEYDKEAEVGGGYSSSSSSQPAPASGTDTVSAF